MFVFFETTHYWFKNGTFSVFENVKPKYSNLINLILPDLRQNNLALYVLAAVLITIMNEALI